MSALFPMDDVQILLPNGAAQCNVHADAWTFGTHCTLELCTQPHSLELLVHTVDGWCEDAGLHVAALAAGQQPQQRNVGGAWQLVQQVVDQDAKPAAANQSMSNSSHQPADFC